MQQPNLKYLIQTAKLAGEKVKEIYYSDESLNIKDKGEDSPVTKADFASEKILKERLEKFKIPILSEETEDDQARLKSDYLFIIDPLDGTKDFIDKTNEFSILIGLAYQGRPLMGVVYNPVKDVCYYARKGSGAYKINPDLSEEKITVSKVKDYRDMRILFSRNHIKETEKEFAQKNKIGYKINYGSAGLKIALIAEGKADIYINSSDKASQWDTCSGNIILTEAGGKITDLDGKELIYNIKETAHLNGFLITSGTKHEDILSQIPFNFDYL